MKIVTASASGIVIQMPATPISFGRINMNTATRIKERIDEINAEIKPVSYTHLTLPTIA